jgi:hypothetical protein
MQELSKPTSLDSSWVHPLLPIDCAFFWYRFSVALIDTYCVVIKEMIDWVSLEGLQLLSVLSF